MRFLIRFLIIVQEKHFTKYAYTSSQRLQSHDDGAPPGDLGDQRLWSSSCYDRPPWDAGPHVSYDAHGGYVAFLIKI